MSLSRPIKIVIGLVVVVVLLAVAWLVFLRPEEEEEFDETERISTDIDVGERPDSFDGTWTVSDCCTSQAGLRIEEDLTAVPNHTAVGRSSDVTGSVVVSGTTISEGSFTVDLTELEFTDDPGLPVANRANAMKSRGLETDEFPEATFELTAPVELGSLPPDQAELSEDSRAGEADQDLDVDDAEFVTATVTGDLTLHGVTRSVTFEVAVASAGGVVRLTTIDPVPVVLADYDIEKPTAPMVADIADEGSFEFEIFLRLDA